MKEIEIVNPYGFVYITTNLINGKRYVGRCCMQTTRKNAWKNYLGSGKALENAIKKYGKENFKREIISFAYNNEELNQQEIGMIKFLNAAESEDYYNISDKYYYNVWKTLDEEKKEQVRKKMSENSIWKNLNSEELEKRKQDYHNMFIGDKNPFFHKSHTLETKEKISLKNKGKTTGDKNASFWKGKTGINSPMFGTTHTAESKLKMSISAKNRIKRDGSPTAISVDIITKNNKYHFNTLRDCYKYCKENNLIPNTYKKKEPYPMMCEDSFMKKIRKQEIFQLFDYIIDGKV